MLSPNEGFWCDGFDLDLVKLVPGAGELLELYRDVRLVTTGTANAAGKMVHPSVWNGIVGLTAYFSLDAERMHDPGYAGPQPAVCKTHAPLLICTFPEMIRDCWCHQYLAMIDGAPVWDSKTLCRELRTLMHAQRGWREMPLAEVRRAKETVYGSLWRAVDRFLEVGIGKGMGFDLVPLVEAVEWGLIAPRAAGWETGAR